MLIVYFLIRSSTAESSSYQIILETGWTPFPTLKECSRLNCMGSNPRSRSKVEVQGLESETFWLIVRHFDPFTNETVEPLINVYRKQENVYKNINHNRTTKSCLLLINMGVDVMF